MLKAASGQFASRGHTANAQAAASLPARLQKARITVQPLPLDEIRDALNEVVVPLGYAVCETMPETLALPRAPSGPTMAMTVVGLGRANQVLFTTRVTAKRMDVELLACIALSRAFVAEVWEGDRCLLRAGPLSPAPN